MIKSVMPVSVLMYIFYNMPNEKAQVQAAEALEARGWHYVKEDFMWVKMQ
jgi:CCR4-NOT transcriptional regulation complex NOT5 subunit